MFSVVIPIVGLSIVWILATWRPETRNWKALTALAIASVVVFGALQIDGLTRSVLGLASAVAIGLILLRPGRIASLDATDRKANALLSEVEASLDGASSEVPRDTFVAALLAPPFSVRATAWRPAGRFYRLILSGRSGMRTDDGRTIDASLTPYRRAGRHYWKLALDRRVIGRRHQATEASEQLLLQSLLDDFNEILARSTATDAAINEGWDLQAEDCIDEVTSLNLRLESSLVDRRLLLDSLSAQLVVARGDRSGEAMERAERMERARHDGCRFAEPTGTDG